LGGVVSKEKIMRRGGVGRLCLDRGRLLLPTGLIPSKISSRSSSSAAVLTLNEDEGSLLVNLEKRMK